MNGENGPLTSCLLSHRGRRCFQQQVKQSLVLSLPCRVNTVKPPASILSRSVQPAKPATAFPYPGGIVRVWEKAVVQRETPSYAKAREAVEREEEKRLKRKLTVLDAAKIFPLAINRATKEITTLYEINCDTLEFFIMEGNNYDSAGDRIAREANFDMNLWVAVRPGSVMEVLSKKMCEQ